MKRTLLAILFTVTLLLANCDQPPARDVYPGETWQWAESPEELGWSAEKLAVARAYSERIGSAAVMIVADGVVIDGWGDVTRNYMCHSMRKSLLSALYGIYVAESKIDPSKTLQELGINDYTRLTQAERQATVADLLKARSGVYIPAVGETAEMKAARPKRGSHPPGTFWYYNNWDFNALGTIFCQETGKDLYQAFETDIAVPLGMQDFRLEEQRYSYEYWLSMHPAYPFRISARDLARVGQLALQRGKWQGQQILPAGWIEESTQPHSRTDQTGTYSGYGYMWWIAAKDYGEIKAGSYAASGYGGHTLKILPHLNTVIALRVNTDDPNVRHIGSSEVDDLVLTILAARQDG